ncbi:MAG: hypothetical protein EXS03_04760 [Phycisphaerales bacterium]|nr:hypothetical protein [Phycisphaerales bacterium]
MSWRSPSRPDALRAVCGLVTAAWVGLHAHGDDLVWPRSALSSRGVTVTLSQPQSTQWLDGVLDAKVAVAIRLPPPAREIVGTVSIRAASTMDPAAGTVTLRSITVPALRLEAEESAIPALREALDEVLATGPITARFDDLVATLPAHGFPSAPREPAPPGAVPLITIPGGSAATFSPMVVGELEGIADSAILLFRTVGGHHYLFLGGRWLATATLAAPAWSFVDPGELPPSFALIPEESVWSEALVGVIGTVANRRALLAASLLPQGAADARSLSRDRFPAPGSTTDPLLWWNPWTLSWWSARCANEGASATPVEAPRTTEPASRLVQDPLAENRMVGLDGRVYAYRPIQGQDADWYRSTMDGPWTPLTSERSTLRNLKADQLARDAALACAASRAAWAARQRELRATPGANSCDRLMTMAGVRPTSNSFRCVNRSLMLPPETPPAAP